MIGQEDVKKVLAVAVYNHYKRLTSNQDDSDGVEISKVIFYYLDQLEVERHY